jgi:predicted RNase H-like nuclease (RuvC/YqgF family)
MKRCSGCFTEKSVDGFHTGKSQCKECRKQTNPKDLEIARLKKELAESNALVKILMNNIQNLGSLLKKGQKKNMSQIKTN